MDRITDFISRPRPITLGTGTYLVGEMRVRDLADLQDWLDRRWESPMEPLRGLLDAMDDVGRRKALRDVWDAVEAGPPLWGTDDARKMVFSDARGLLELFRVVLRQHQSLSIEAVEAIAESTTPDQFGAMLTIWHRPDPADELERMIGVTSRDSWKSVGWCRAICELIEMTGYTPEQVEGLTLRQVRLIRCGGKASERGTSVAPRTNLRDVVRAARAKFGVVGGESNG